MRRISVVSTFLLASTVLPGVGEAQEPSLLGDGRGIDHVILYVRDLETAKDVYRDTLGFIVEPAPGESYPLPSGYKTSWVSFERNWLEFRAIDDPEKAAESKPWAVEFLEKQDGALALVLNTSSVEATADFLRRRGLEVPELSEIPTVTRFFTLNELVLPGPRVTLAEYTPEYEAKFRLAETPEWARHANTARWITSVWIAVNDLQTATERYEAIGLSAGSTLELPELGAIGREMKLGSGAILLLQPGDSGGKVASFLARSGEGIMGVSIEVRSLATARELIEANTGRWLTDSHGPFGNSLLVPAEIAHGLWIEMFERS